jgi:uncharacterized protein DUF4154
MKNKLMLIVPSSRAADNWCNKLKAVWGVILVLGCIVMAVYPSGDAYADSALEYRVKAAFLYNFTKFVRWPETAFHNTNSPIEICILGDTPFEEASSVIQNKTAGGRKLKIYRVNSLDDINGCHVLFISETAETSFFDSLSRIQHLNILTVGNRTGFALKGGVINFVMSENKVHFEINTKAADRAELKMSAQLLKIAKIVEEK